MPVREKPLVRGDVFAGRFRADGRTGELSDSRGEAAIACPSELMSALRHTLNHECGPAADAILHSMGRRWGELLADRMESDVPAHFGARLHDIPAAQVQAVLTSALAYWGWGRPEWDWQRHDRGLLEIAVVNGPAGVGQETDLPAADHLLCGALAGLFSRLTGQALICLQTESELPGQGPARFVLGLPERLKQAEEAARCGQPHDRIVAVLESIQV